MDIAQYIGVTGFMTDQEVAHALGVFPRQSSRKLMVGVLGSFKTIFEGKRNKWPNRYPLRPDIADIFPSDERALNLLHYSTDQPDTIYDQLTELVEIGGPRLHGFQLNITWPSPRQIEQFKQEHPEMVIVLQVGRRALFHPSGAPILPSQLPRIINYYTGIDYVLLDRSGGTGTLMSEDTLDHVTTLLATHNTERTYEVGVAGGLSAETMQVVKPVLTRFSTVSIDAEGQLRDQFDELDLDRVERYIVAALRAYADSEVH